MLEWYTFIISFTGTLVILLLIVIIYILYKYNKYLLYQKDFYDNLVTVNRRESCYNDIAYNKKYNMDIKVYGISKLLEKRYSEFLDNCNEMMKDFNKKKARYLATFSVLENLMKIITYGYVGIRVFSNVLGEIITIGSCVMYINDLSNFSSRISKISENIMQIRQMFKYLEPYITFMEYKNSEIDGGVNLVNDIEQIKFEHVYFKYNESDNYVLKDINFEINKGNIIAIAGENGSGKTTIIKLLCKLYTPTKGKIYINGIVLENYNTESYLEKVSVIFQDYKLFNYSIKKNITISYNDDQKLNNIIDKIKLNKLINKLPNGVETILGKEYDQKGIELSGGEAQKVAIARAGFKDASLYIMDEPTSALDPIAEAEVFEDMRIVNGKTTIFVSHRMYSCQLCDKILVIGNCETSSQS